jgi:uncharacterized repeat protein (TIGR03803 family)
MRIPRFGHISLCGCVAAALLAGCSGSQGNLNGTNSLPNRNAGAALYAVRPLRPTASEDVLYTFAGSPDGQSPFSGLLATKTGEFFGTTYSGGSGPNGGYGTVYEISASRAERVLYSFAGGSDGSTPQAGVIAGSGGVLYGTTSDGGGSSTCSNGCGTVYELTPSGSNYTERVLYAFKGRKDGSHPLGNLTLVNGKLYGTTGSGGGSTMCDTSSLSGCGTVFNLIPKGNAVSEKIVYAFKGGNDGALPLGPLIDVNGRLYGTTYGGGGIAGCHPLPYNSTDCGTVFSLTPSGHETVLYRFKGMAAGDGGNPRAALLESRGAFFGVTQYAGGNLSLCKYYGCGTAFELTRKGKAYAENVLYIFGTNTNDGAYPFDASGLVADKAGNLYGTLWVATTPPSCFCGAVFKLHKKARKYSESVLHYFGGGTDGAYPVAGLILRGSALYGTTSNGGAACYGSSESCGVVFRVTP